MNRSKKILENAATKHSLPLTISEIPIILSFSFDGSDSQEAKTLFTQEMLKRGILASNVFYGSLAHSDAHFKRYARAVNEVFATIAHARKNGGIVKLLEGPIAHSHFARVT